MRGAKQTPGHFYNIKKLLIVFAMAGGNTLQKCLLYNNRVMTGEKEFTKKKKPYKNGARAAPLSREMKRPGKRRRNPTGWKRKLLTASGQLG
jgi:hypothetical protein